MTDQGASEISGILVGEISTLDVDENHFLVDADMWVKRPSISVEEDVAAESDAKVRAAANL
jgi:hypothetical protein